MSRLMSLLSVVAVGALSVASVANAASIGINFASQEINPQQAVTGNAGVVQQGNWNSLRNGSGPAPDPAPNLVDNSNVATGATVTWSSNGTFAIVGGANAAAPGDEQMMNSALFGNFVNNRPVNFTISGSVSSIPYAAYDVYIYLGSDSNGRQTDTTVNGVTHYGSSVNVAGQIDGSSGTAFDYTVGGTAVPITSTNPLARDSGTYAYFPGLTASSFNWSNIGVDFNNNSLTGIQIVEVASVPEPGMAAVFGIGSGLALLRRRRAAK